MAKNGYQNTPDGAVNPDDDQELGFIPSSPPQPKPSKKGFWGIVLSVLSATLGLLTRSIKSPPATNFIKNHWKKSLMGTFIAVSALQAQIENPQHDTFSWQGGLNTMKRVSHNVGWWVGGAWDIATGAAKPVLKTTNLVNSGTQPAPYFIICKDKDLDKQLADKDPRARAFMKVVQPQLEAEAYRLAFQDAAFYKRNSHFDVGQGGPLAVFHIEAVPPSWSPNVPYLLQGPAAMGRSDANIPGSGCGTNENRLVSPIPGVDSTPGYKAPQP